jgi:hypothetical protein
MRRDGALLDVLWLNCRSKSNTGDCSPSQTLRGFDLDKEFSVAGMTAVLLASGVLSDHHSPHIHMIEPGSAISAVTDLPTSSLGNYLHRDEESKPYVTPVVAVVF